MRSFFIFILQILFIQNSIAQSLDAKTNSLGSCGLTQTTVWSNLENQAGLASINKLVFGIGSRKQFLINELNNHTVVCAIPIYGGVMRRIIKVSTLMHLQKEVLKMKKGSIFD